MKFKLDCSKKHIPKITDLFIQLGLSIDDKAELMIIDNPLHSFNEEDPFEDFKSILYLESFGNKIHVHHAHHKDVYIFHEKLYHLEDTYRDDGFVRVNKSQIVNIRFIKEIEPLIGQKYILILKDNITLDVNRGYYKNFKEYLKL